MEDIPGLFDADADRVTGAFAEIYREYGEKEAAQDINVNGEAVIEFPVEKGGEKDQVTFVYEGKGALNLRKLILK